jgi:predicted transcriptional regulator
MEMISIDEILQLIENKDISITELARISGIPQATLQRNLTKKTKMSHSTYQKIISILNQIEGIYKESNYNSALLNKSSVSIASDSYKTGYGSNVDFFDIIKSQEKTIQSQLKTIDNLFDQLKIKDQIIDDFREIIKGIKTNVITFV